ncbi:hypothetical protein TsFJ059_000213 [Trichoderma semiorbis]|uniref:Uncharacterized protein n=1 Tax=Trichoderma semiorbis TaxID=1491008 RepID=A0A9P8HU47_9HYPO|nr:hypothetical protein TsFJ059_000213 [Trichoderma semiorbis]
MFAPYAALLVRANILPLVTLQQRSSLLSPFSSLLNTSTTTRLFYKHLEFRDSQSSLDLFTGGVFVSPTVASTSGVCSASDPLTLPQCFVTPGRVHLSTQSTHHNPDIGGVCKSPTYQLRQLLHSVGAMFYADNDIYTLHQPQAASGYIAFPGLHNLARRDIHCVNCAQSLAQKVDFSKTASTICRSSHFRGSKGLKGTSR